MYRLIVLALVLVLSGCVKLGSPEGKHEGTTTQVVNVPLKEVIESQIDKASDRAGEKAGDMAAAKTSAAVSATIDTKMKSVQDNVTGLVTAKVDEIGKLIDVNSKIDAKMDLRNRIDATMTAMAKLRVDVQNEQTLSASFRSEIKASLKAFSENLLAMQASIDVTGQAGVGNKVEKLMQTMQTELKAGRDVYSNSMSRETVEVMVAEKEYNQRIILGIMAVIQIVALAAMGYVYKSQRQRNDNTTKLLMIALGKMPPEAADEIKHHL